MVAAAHVVVQRAGHERRGGRQAVDRHQAAPRQLRESQAAAVPGGGAVRRALCASRRSMIQSSELLAGADAAAWSMSMARCVMMRWHKASAIIHAWFILEPC